jgi:hypothetical protein
LFSLRRGLKTKRFKKKKEVSSIRVLEDKAAKERKKTVFKERS